MMRREARIHRGFHDFQKAYNEYLDQGPQIQISVSRIQVSNLPENRKTFTYILFSDSLAQSAASDVQVQY